MFRKCPASPISGRPVILEIRWAEASLIDPAPREALDGHRSPANVVISHRATQCGLCSSGPTPAQAGP